jgi:putative tryptophan/tyrosine transport system substrate-binding protein
MKRREFIGLVGSAAVAGASIVRAGEQVKVYRIAVADPITPVSDLTETGPNPQIATLFRELRRLGYVEGRNLVVQRFSGSGDNASYDKLVRDVVAAAPDLIIAISNLMVLRFKAATTNIPVVGSMADPIAFGIVSSLARPGGNITGVASDAGIEIWGKRLELLREAVPDVSRVGFITSKYIMERAPGAALRKATQQTSMSLVGSSLDGLLQEPEYRRVFESFEQGAAQGLVVGENPENFQQRHLIVTLAERARLPAIYPYRDYVEIGGLMSYGPNGPDRYRRLAIYVDMILKGANPAETPIYQMTAFDAAINLKTANSLGLTIPTSLLAQADEVIE